MRKIYDRSPVTFENIIGIFIAATAAYDWMIFYKNLRIAFSFYSQGFYMLPSLTLLSVGASAAYLTYAGIILLRLRRPLSHYEIVAPNAIAVLAILAPYRFAWTSHGNLFGVSVYIAYAFLICGTLFTLTSLFFLRRSFSITPQARSLVTAGPYSLIRHPMYVSSILSILGLTLLIDSPEAFGLFLIIAALQIRRALYEEALLEANFPEYAIYASRVGRFIPRLAWYRRRERRKIVSDLS